ncbi:MAG: nucleotidyltransferase domain-containing protein [Anaerolineae bacterium]|nr:nucleotidyltransferase domain-containing protein [Anaerolineae bacterium]
MRIHRVSPEEKGRIIELLSAALAAEPDVVFAYLHGSFVETEGFRDIDVAVFFDPLPERLWRREVELADQLERALRDAGFSFPIDVQALNEAPPAFRAAAIRPRQIPFCRDEDRRSEFEAATWSEYADVRRLHEAYLRDVLSL